ncbi:NADH-quinone oxidoreductase subunit C [Streptomyces sp. NPDC049954]|uniref:NADH-quinone oxidoreductase subunit C n=1 Tax=Streptomyces sp. NPDC049954 TaxID=3155779 RepID=UPI00344689DE
MTGWLPQEPTELFGPEATAEEAYALLTVDVPAGTWTTALETARRTLGCTYFDWLSAVDEPGTGFRVCAHVVALAPVRRLLLRTTVPHEAPVLASAVGVYAGAAWHERETHEMFGVRFEDHPGLTPLLLPENFEGHPLRKDFVLAARVAKAWPGAKEPGESGHGAPKRRQMLPPGVPDPNEWGPLKGQLPDAPARPARGARAATGERPARRTRTAAGGSAAQRGDTAATPATETAQKPGQSPAPVQPGQSPESGQKADGAPGPQAPAEQASTTPARPAGPRRARSASAGSASQRAATAPDEAGKGDGDEAAPAPGHREDATAPSPAAPAAPPAKGSADAPWHHARPAFEEPGEGAEGKSGEKPGQKSGEEPGQKSGEQPDGKRERPAPEPPAPEPPASEDPRPDDGTAPETAPGPAPQEDNRPPEPPAGGDPA